jgi:hypothetical protein
MEGACWCGVEVSGVAGDLQQIHLVVLVLQLVMLARSRHSATWKRAGAMSLMSWRAETLRPCLAGLQKGLQLRLHAEPCQTGCGGAAPAMKLPVEPRTASTSEVEPRMSGSAQLCCPFPSPPRVGPAGSVGRRKTAGRGAAGPEGGGQRRGAGRRGLAGQGGGVDGATGQGAGRQGAGRGEARLGQSVVFHQNFVS